FGKFLSCFMLVLLMLGLTCVYPIILLVTSSPDHGPIFTNLLGTVLLTGCYVSVGLFCSSLTDNQIVAGVLTFFGLMFFWLISWAAQSASSNVAEIINYLSLIDHYYK